MDILAFYGGNNVYLYKYKKIFHKYPYKKILHPYKSTGEVPN